MPIIYYLQFLLIGLHFHQCLTITKHRLPRNEIFKSLVFKQSYGKNAFVCMVIKTWNDIHKELKDVMLNTFSLVKLKLLLIEFYMNMCKAS